MNILITGGTGFIGTALVNDLQRSGHTVLVTTRKRSGSRDRITWHPPELVPPDVMSRIDAVVNLAGESISSGRWTKARKELLIQSRIETTRTLVQSIKKAGKGPKTLISASAIGYYGPHKDEFVTEDTPAASDFLAGLCRAWEAEALKAEQLGVRVVLLRTGIVLGKGGGALTQMSLPFKLFAGGHISSGKQWLSWIHMDDEVGIIRFALENRAVSGPLNLTAPHPETNAEFSSALGKALGRPSWLPVPGFVLRLALGEFGEMALTGQRVIPEKALQAGYEFKYPDLNEALNGIFQDQSSK